MLRQGLFQFLVGLGYRNTGFFPSFLRTAQTQRDSQDRIQQVAYQPARHSTHYRQIGDQGGQPRSKLTPHLDRQRRLRHRPAVTYHLVQAIFRALRVLGRQFGDLMSSRFAFGPALSRVGGQQLLATLTLVGEEIDHVLHLLDWN